MKHLLNLLILQFGFSAMASSQISVQDEASFRNIVLTMEQGWNTKSGKLFASYFASDHDYIVWTGMYFSNQSIENNAQGHQRLFDSFYKSIDLRLKVDKMRPIREDLVLVHVLGATYEHDTPIPENPKVIITLLIEKQNGEWKIISFHNCDIELSFSPDQQAGPIPVKEMYTSWYKS